MLFRSFKETYNRDKKLQELVLKRDRLIKEKADKKKIDAASAELEKYFETKLKLEEILRKAEDLKDEPLKYITTIQLLKGEQDKADKEEKEKLLLESAESATRKPLGLEDELKLDPEFSKLRKSEQRQLIAGIKRATFRDTRARKQFIKRYLQSTTEEKKELLREAQRGIPERVQFEETDEDIPRRFAPRLEEEEEAEAEAPRYRSQKERKRELKEIQRLQKLEREAREELEQTALAMENLPSFDAEEDRQERLYLEKLEQQRQQRQAEIERRMRQYELDELMAQQQKRYKGIGPLIPKPITPTVLERELQELQRARELYDERDRQLAIEEERRFVEQIEKERREQIEKEKQFSQLAKLISQQLQQEGLEKQQIGRAHV